MLLQIQLSDISLQTALVVSLLSVWVLVGLFTYLGRFTQRRYFNIWTAAWLFYAIFLTLSLSVENFPPSALLMLCKNGCIATAAVLMLWGSFDFLHRPVSQRLIAVTLLFVAVWSYAAAYEFPGELWVQIPAFALLSLASGFTAHSYCTVRKGSPLMGAGLLTFGFLLWSLYLLAYPFLQTPAYLLNALFLISGILQLYLAISMIILVLEEARHTAEAAQEQVLKERKNTKLFRDVAELKEQRYKSLFKNTTEGIVLAHPATFEILDMNPAARALLRADQDTVHGLLTRFYPSLTSEASEKCELTNLAEKSESELTRADGTKLRVQMRGRLVRVGEESVFQLFFSELTDRARLEMQLRQAERLSALGQMISGVAHELNNPLASIKGYTDLVLLTADLDPKTRASLIKVSQESSRAAKLVQNFLAFARPEEPQFEPLRVNDLLRTIIEKHRGDLEKQGICLSQHFSEKNPYIHGNEDHLLQVFNNLVQNAANALANHSKERAVNITSRVHDGRVQIRFEDTGPGVSDDVLPHIFEPFFTTKRLGAGTGLGLSISYSVIISHKGRIYYEPRPGGGARFTIDLPLAQEEPVVPAVENPVMAAFPANPANQGMKVLVVDDEVTIASLLKEMLEIMGHHAEVYNDPEKALAALLEERFDLVISDFRMPGMTGGQIYEQVVAADPRLSSRFIFLTGDMVNDETKTFFDANKVTVLLKPFQFATIEAAVARATESHAESAPENPVTVVKGNFSNSAQACGECC